jgi:hypothetical protein
MLVRRFRCDATPRVLRGAGTVEEAKQHCGLRAEPRGWGSVRGRSQLRCHLQSLGDLSAHDTTLRSLGSAALLRGITGGLS